MNELIIRKLRPRTIKWHAQGLITEACRAVSRASALSATGLGVVRKPDPQRRTQVRTDVRASRYSPCHLDHKPAVSHAGSVSVALYSVSSNNYQEKTGTKGIIGTQCRMRYRSPSGLTSLTDEGDDCDLPAKLSEVLDARFSGGRTV